MPDFSPSPMTTAALAAEYPPPRPAVVGQPNGGPVAPLAVVNVVLDERTRRLIETAIRAYPAVIFVGAPGTGKGAIIQHLVARVHNAPSDYGFAERAGASWPNPVKRTPDESTSVSDMIGGLTPDTNGTLRWGPGYVLDALRHDRWLILDELNRADLDKILGPLLSWLAGETVEIGTLTPAPDSPRILISWDPESAESYVEPEEGLDVALNTKDRPSEVVFYAGRDFRLLGTYNPQDAHRVFTLGQALGRRLRQIPIPPLSPVDTNAMLTARYPDLAAVVTNRIVSLYAAHQSHGKTRLGPALFLEMPKYVRAGLLLASEPLDSPALVIAGELICEAYLVCLGRIFQAYGTEARKHLIGSDEFKSALGGDDAVTWLLNAVAPLE